MTKPTPALEPCFLGVECGGTSTFALLVTAQGEVLGEKQAGPANLRLLSDRQLGAHFRTLSWPKRALAAVAIGMAGARTDFDRARIQRVAALVWPDIPCYATNDLETALLADSNAGPQQQGPRVLVLSGTGSCCFGRDARGRGVRVGGWGHFLGDRGSGYEIGLSALQRVIAHFDHTNEWPTLGGRFLRSLQLNEAEDLIAWVQSAPKNAVAALAIEVFAAWAAGDTLARQILACAARRLAQDAVICARKLGSRSGVTFVLAGSVLLKQPRFANWVRRLIRLQMPRAKVAALRRPSVWGAVHLAEQLVKDEPHPVAALSPPHRSRVQTVSQPFLSKALGESPTEQRNPLSRNLDRMSARAAIALMLRQDAQIPSVLLRERSRIEEGLRLIVSAFRQGGRLFYVGAGTSGRLGVLDASECPPTFRTPPEMVQGIIAGGPSALWQSVEGAEDDAAAGGRALQARRLHRRDVVVGIAASGRTPFVWGALAEANRRGATTILLCFNPGMRRRAPAPVDLILAPNLGPEVLTGSTRLKAGTATKLILNIWTTLAMVRLGKVASNLMIDVAATNEKLRDRAVRIVRALTDAPAEAAQQALERSDWKIKVACRRLRRR